MITSFEFPPAFGGGIGTYTAAMARALAVHGHRTTVVTVAEESTHRREHIDIGPHGIEVVRVPAPRTCGPEPAATLRAWIDLSDRFADYLHRLIRVEGDAIDAIEFPEYRGEGLAFLSSTTPGKRPPCVVRLHTPCLVLGRYNRARDTHPVLEAFEIDAVRMADRLVSPSLALAREMQRLCPGLPSIDVLPNPADPEFLAIDPERERARLGLVHADNAGSNEILYVGRLEERKGVETLIRAAPSILESCPGAVLRLVGGDMFRGADQPSMLAHLREILPERFAHRVVFEGAVPRERLVERYLHARVCVFPSLFENFPNTCLESMALARPTVGTDNSGMAEMIEHGVSGVITPSGSVDALARDVAALYNAPAPDRARMGAAARERVIARYHPDRIVDEYVRVMHHDGLPTRVAARPHPRRAGVAVVIPCFNHGRYIDEAIESARTQTQPPEQIVVVDDGSTDPDTRETLDRLARDRIGHIRVIHKRNGGLAAARNTGVRATDTEYFIPLDADDLLEPTFIERLLPALESDRTLGYGYSHVRYFGAHTGEWRCPNYDPRQLLVGNLSVATAVIRREAFELAGGYQPRMRGGFEDWELWLGLLEAGYHGVCVPEPLFLYRKHASGSMLRDAQHARPGLIDQIIHLHPLLFAANNAWALIEKDRMFFDAHTQAWANLVALDESQQRVQQLERRAGHGPAGGVSLNGSRPYSQVERKPPAHLGSQAPSDHAEAIRMARQELARLRSSRVYRAIQRFKASAVYRAYAERRYGPGWEHHLGTGGPLEQLRRLQSSRGYKVIVTLRRTPVYRVLSNLRPHAEHREPVR